MGLSELEGWIAAEGLEGDDMKPLIQIKDFCEIQHERKYGDGVLTVIGILKPPLTFENTIVARFPLDHPGPKEDWGTRDYVSIFDAPDPGRPMKDNKPKRLRDLPQDEQEPFKKYLIGKCVPRVHGIPDEEQDFYWPADYRRWKSNPDFWSPM